MKTSEAIRIGKLAARRSSLQIIQDRDLLIVALKAAPEPVNAPTLRDKRDLLHAAKEYDGWWYGPRAAALAKVKP